MSSADRTLLDRWIARRDAEAFNTIASRHAPMVYATCRRILGNATDAEDVSQECFEAVAGARKAPHTDCVGAWLHGIATNQCLQHIRSEGRRRARETHFAGAEAAPETATWNDIRHLVDEAVAELPEDLRGPIVAHFLNGEPQATVAKATGVSRQTITYRIGKGIERIRQSLKQRGVDLPAPGLTAMMGTHLVQHGPVPAALTASLGKIALSGAARPMAIAMNIAGGVLTMKKVILTAVLILVGVGIALTVASRNRAKDTANDQRILQEIATFVHTPPGSQPIADAVSPKDDTPAVTNTSGAPFTTLPHTQEPAETKELNTAPERQDDAGTVVENVMVASTHSSMPVTAATRTPSTLYANRAANAPRMESRWAGNSLPRAPS